MSGVSHWNDTVRRAGATAGDDAIHAAGADLHRRWSEPQRHYHTLAHLRSVLSIVDSTAAPGVDRDAVRLAAWFHDAVYDPRAAGMANEEASGALAVSILAALGVPSATVEEVRRLVLLTAGHEPEPGDRNGELLCDADLAILSADPDAYDTYAAEVRREYAHVPDDLFRAGRTAVLRHLRDHPALYRLPATQGWTAPARANLERELAALT
jgi:predicted metal-dependent HD superfamily phosphohydrolase